MAFNSQMHERNIYKNRPDFTEIATNYPEFRKYTLSDAKGKIRVDFTDPDALRILTKILLKKDFNLKVEIPKGFLIPTVPQRLNYILWIEDLLSILPKKNKILRGIDIGCGPCAIFSILGAKKNGWMFTATETSEEALQWALNNIKDNDLTSLIKVVKVQPNSALSEVLTSNEDYDFCLCNPPFFENMEDIRKKSPKVKETITTVVKEEEIFAEGGEVAFVKRIIEESLVFKGRVKLYTSMFGKKKSFVEIYRVLQCIKDISVTKSQFCQGNTIRWGVAWTFDKSVNFGSIEKPKPKKNKKVKPPLVHHVPKDVKCSNYNVQDLSRFIFNALKDLEILIKVARVHEHYTESQITTDKNTWSHQRRKRREMKRNVETADGVNLSPNKNSKCELETTSYLNTTTSISMVDNSGVGSSISSKRKSTISEGEMEDLEMAASEERLESSDSASKKHKLVKDDSKNCKKPRLDFDPLEDSEPRRTLSENVSDDNRDSDQPSSASGHVLTEARDELIVCDSEFIDDDEGSKESEAVENKGVQLIKADEINDVNFEPKPLLFCTLKIRRAKDFVRIEMNCPDEANRESMYQILQYLKNKLH